MNIFKMTDEEFERHLQLNIDTLDPDELLQRLIECGLAVEKEEYYSFYDNDYDFENQLLDNSYNLTIHRTSFLERVLPKKKSISDDELMRRAA